MLGMINRIQVHKLNLKNKCLLSIADNVQTLAKLTALNNVLLFGLPGSFYDSNLNTKVAQFVIR